MPERSARLLKYLPALGIVPLLDTTLPVLGYHPSREIAGYFQAMGVLHYGVESFFVLTPDESFSSLHLHSTLSAPLLALGYPEGGRLVSFGMAVLAVAALAVACRRLGLARTAIIAPLLLWLQPLFARSAYAFMPETTSVALTTGSIAAALVYRDTRDGRWYAVTVGLLVAGVTNHMWEATIALPLAVVFLHGEDFREAAGVAAATVGAVAGVFVLGGLQPSGPTNLFSHGVFALEPGEVTAILLPSGIPVHPLNLHESLSIPFAIVLVVVFGLRAIRRDRLEDWVIASWLVSGLSVPFLLAHGYLVHGSYYLWALWAPLALGSGVLLAEWIDRYPSRSGRLEVRSLFRTTIAAIVVLSFGYVLIFEAGALAATDVPVAGGVTGPDGKSPSTVQAGEAVTAGRDIDRIGAASAGDITFVGEWGAPELPTMYLETPAISRTVIYAGVPASGRKVGDPSARASPTVVRTLEEATDCKVAVVARGDQLEVRECSELSDSALPSPQSVESREAEGDVLIRHTDQKQHDD